MAKFGVWSSRFRVRENAVWQGEDFSELSRAAPGEPPFPAKDVGTRLSEQPELLLRDVRPSGFGCLQCSGSDSRCFGRFAIITGLFH
jgi:hypothetical protein